MEDPAAEIRSLGESGIADDVEIGVTGEAEAGAEGVAAGFFDVGEDFESGREAVAGVESHDAGDGFLPVGLEGVRAGVGRVERGMGLEDKVGLAGEPDARAGEVGDQRFGGLDAGVGVVVGARGVGVGHGVDRGAIGGCRFL